MRKLTHTTVSSLVVIAYFPTAISFKLFFFVCPSYTLSEESDGKVLPAVLRNMKKFLDTVN